MDKHKIRIVTSWEKEGTIQIYFMSDLLEELTVILATIS
jgi:hypothetical protein